MSLSAPSLLHRIHICILSLLAFAILASLLLLIFHDYIKRFPTCDF